MFDTKIKYSVLLIGIAGFLLMALAANAQYPSPPVLRLNASDLTCGEVPVGKKKTFTPICCKGKTPGVAKVNGLKVRFTSLAKKKRNARTQKKRRRFQQMLRAGKPFCRKTGPTPTPTPDNDLFLNYDNSLNLNANGKACFNVPSELNGNVDVGATTFATICQECHTPNERYGRKFDWIRQKTAEAPMFFTPSELSDQAIADITAFLNFVNANSCF